MVIQCKMCGGDIAPSENQRVGRCLYCGTLTALPSLSDERRASQYNRANHFRMGNDFDRARSIYESIIAEDENEAEAHWGAALCRYGIEYVEDPATKERIPTCRRLQFESILDDPDYLACIERAPDDEAREIYRREGERIERIREGILDISRREAPYDVFICYKEKDERGERTLDSKLAQEIYEALTQAGIRTFFSRISLEDTLGEQYEPYIFAALNSARVMLVVTTKPEHVGATWVKNEWSRFHELARRDKTRLLIPCYRDMDPYDLPDQLSVQCQDMSKIGFIQDLLRGIRKVVSPPEPVPASQRAEGARPEEKAAPSVDTMLRRAFLWIEGGDFQKADALLENILDAQPECARAHLGKLLVSRKLVNEEALAASDLPFTDDINFRHAVQFSGESEAKRLMRLDERRQERIRKNRYDNLCADMDRATGQEDLCERSKLYGRLANDFQNMHSYRDSERKAAACGQLQESTKELCYRTACERMNKSVVSSHDAMQIRQMFDFLGDYKDSKQNSRNVLLLQTCKLSEEEGKDGGAGTIAAVFKIIAVIAASAVGLVLVLGLLNAIDMDNEAVTFTIGLTVVIGMVSAGLCGAFRSLSKKRAMSKRMKRYGRII